MNFLFFALLALALAASNVFARNDKNPPSTTWPQELSSDEGTIVVYQPQPENLQGNILTGRAAMSMELKDKKNPIFGVFWFSAQIETDRSNDSASISGIEVTKVGWPDSKDAGEQRFTKVVEDELDNAIFQTRLSKLTASLTASEKVQESLADLNNAPPKLVFTDELAVLLLFDGKPDFKGIDNSHYQRAINTPLAVAKDTRTQTFYLFSGSLWYSASNALGPWGITTDPPGDLVALMPKSDDKAPPKIPTIVTATEPTELIATDGKPNWISLVGGELLYVDNTETPWLRDLANGNMYLLLSGRWYRSKSTHGEWTFVRGDELPRSFQKIPPGSDIGGLRTSVAGTEEADRAVVDAQIPQTAAIKRSAAKLEVKFDGAPEFQAIKGTDVAYALNTDTQVLLIDNKYYAVDNGVWFTSDEPSGPWSVADKIPDKKNAEIPPSAPVYNTTYVTIYDSTPEVVHVGYTPGYLWAYPYYGVPVYGTGWYYPPYFGPYYYPRTPTWGMHVGYNPWTGWSFGVSWGGPFLSIGVAWGGGYRSHCCAGGWYGGGRYTNINRNINIDGDINIGNSINVGDRTKIEKNINNKARLDNRIDNRKNIYKRPENRGRNAGNSARKEQLQRARSNHARNNNLFADHGGNVARKEGGQWQQHIAGKWRDVPSESRQQVKDKADTIKQKRREVPPEQRQQFHDRSDSTRDRWRSRTRAHRGAQQFNHRQMNREFRARAMGRARHGGGGGRFHR